MKSALHQHQVGRVVKAPDLRSGLCIETWVRTPHLVLVIVYLFAEITSIGPASGTSVSLSIPLDSGR